MQANVETDNRTRLAAWPLGRLAVLPFRVTAALVAILLLISVFAKTHQLVMELNSWDAVTHREILTLLLVTGEVALAVGLLRSWRPRLLRAVSILAFAAFAAYNAHLMSQSAPTCQCLGQISVVPQQMLLVDLAVILMLLMSETSSTNGVQIQAFLRDAALYGSLVVLLLSVCGLVWFQSPHRAMAALTRTSVGVYPEKPRVGYGDSGQLKTLTVTIFNERDTPLVVVGAKRACGNVYPSMVFPLQVHPHGERTVDLLIGFAPEETEFRRELVFYTTDPQVPILHVEITGNARSN